MGLDQVGRTGQTTHWAYWTHTSLINWRYKVDKVNCLGKKGLFAVLNYTDKIKSSCVVHSTLFNEGAAGEAGMRGWERRRTGIAAFFLSLEDCFDHPPPLFDLIIFGAKVYFDNLILNKAVPVQCISYYLLHEILSLSHSEFVWLCKNDDLMS